MASCRVRRACARSSAVWRATRCGSITWALSRRVARRWRTPMGSTILWRLRRAVRHPGRPRASRAAAQDRRDDLSDRLDRRAAEQPERRLGALQRRRVRRQGARDLRSRRRPADLRRAQRRPRQRHHRRPDHADHARRHLCLRSRPITTMPGGPGSTPPAAASSPASRPTRRLPS